MTAADAFVYASFAVQLSMARTVLNEMNLDKVYMFDKIHYFTDATVSVHNTIRYLIKNSKYAVLSSAAQTAFTALDYRRYASCLVQEDDTGFYIAAGL